MAHVGLDDTLNELSICLVLPRRPFSISRSRHQSGSRVEFMHRELLLCDCVCVQLHRHKSAWCTVQTDRQPMHAGGRSSATSTHACGDDAQVLPCVSSRICLGKKPVACSGKRKPGNGPWVPEKDERHPLGLYHDVLCPTVRTYNTPVVKGGMSGDSHKVYSL